MQTDNGKTEYAVPCIQDLGAIAELTAGGPNDNGCGGDKGFGDTDGFGHAVTGCLIS